MHLVRPLADDDPFAAKAGRQFFVGPWKPVRPRHFLHVIGPPTIVKAQWGTLVREHDCDGSELCKAGIAGLRCPASATVA
mmetsp:Transcript_21856/g.54661  ORF Transcript_21856/g.54661 Transcript_21856/m.54661 type:complete len:80 (+) Transcript_21856:454-693(+)